MFFGGGGSADFIFMGARIFLRECSLIQAEGRECPREFQHPQDYVYAAFCLP